MRYSKKTFTLIELVIVVAIIAILAGAMTPIIRSSRNEAKIAKAQADLEAMKVAAQMYYIDTGVWPTSPERLVSSSIDGWDGPYVDRLNVDPWGRRYSHHTYYKLDKTERCLFSYGPNGKYNSCNPNSDDICVFTWTEPR